ncbi:hypothetical protein [Escherichia coli]|uniref:hypothetical protein n=1 Tax=Escherichia coli TaxID=562 RepID=UPI000D6A2266|nr:hypothetical protein [Escherichia coli]
MSTITKELAKLFRKITNSEIDAEGNAHVVLSPADSLLINNARIALASLEAEDPWRNPVLAYADSYRDMAKRGVESIPVWSVITDLERNIAPLYTAPPAPVSVPDEDLLHMAASAIDDLLSNKDRSGAGVWADIPAKLRRAAMLQAEPVSNSDELPLDYLQGHKDGLEWAAQLAEANHPQTGDWLYDDPIDLARAIRKGPDMPTVQGGNSPVIPDGWVMVPVELTPDMRAAWDSAPYTDDDDNDMQAAYRAMIAAAPQWKVK